MTISSTTFSELKLNSQLLRAVNEMGLITPTLIQEKSVPRIMSGQDVLGIAPTGTGKTAAYLLPVLMTLKFRTDHGNPRAFVLAPSKELAIQIHGHCEALSKYLDLRAVAIYGGVGPTEQIQKLQDGCDIVIATPGRFLELYQKEVLLVRDLKIMVLDEADKMMDMGFLPQIHRILEVIPTKRQNLLFSATMPDKVLQLSEDFLEYPQKIEVAPQATPAETIIQKVYLLPNFRTKIALLEELLSDKALNRVIIFAKTKKNANDIGKFLERKDLGPLRVIHANKGQNTRINSMNLFKAGELRVLVSTDVTARGIDITDVSHVINFDVPTVYEDYVHRIGRTGRAKKSGTSITLATPAEEYHITQIEKLMGIEIPQELVPPSLPIFETNFNEKQEMAREIDRQKRLENPDFKGAFHEKKARIPKKTKTKKRR